MGSGPHGENGANEVHGSTRRGAIIGTIAADVSGTGDLRVFGFGTTGFRILKVC